MKKRTVVTILSFMQFALSLAFSWIYIMAAGDNEFETQGTICFCSACITAAIGALIDKEDK